MKTGDWNEEARSLIQRAVPAPSSHNTQPWLFRISPLTIDLYADRTRALPVNDPEDRELAAGAAAWMHPRRRGDGLTVPALAAPVAQLVVRTFNMGGGVGAKDKDLAEASPLLAVLGTERDEVRDWLRAGQALQRVLLTACKHGLQASYLNQPVQVASLRPKLQNIVGSGFPQILLRMG